MPTEEIVTSFNSLRQDIVLLYELKLAMATCQYEMQTLKHRHDQLVANRVRLCFNQILCCCCSLYTLYINVQSTNFYNMTKLGLPNLCTHQFAYSHASESLFSVNTKDSLLSLICLIAVKRGLSLANF